VTYPYQQKRPCQQYGREGVSAQNEWGHGYYATQQSAETYARAREDIHVSWNQTARVTAWAEAVSVYASAVAFAPFESVPAKGLAAADMLLGCMRRSDEPHTWNVFRDEYQVLAGQHNLQGSHNVEVARPQLCQHAELPLGHFQHILFRATWHQLASYHISCLCVQGHPYFAFCALLSTRAISSKSATGFV
jgi:hypothetical protein